METPDELLTFLTEATRDGIWNRLLYRGAAWALMRKDGVLPDGAPRIGATIETDLTEHGFSVLRAALALKEKSGPSDLSSRGFERAANAFEAVVRNGDPADPKRGFHRTVAAAAYHLAEADKTLAGVANFLSDPRRPIETTLRAMMTTPHLGEAGVHPVVASSARELLNKSDNERSGVLSTAMSFLGLYRDPVVAAVTRRCDWRIHDLVEGKTATTLYLVVPPSDISRTKPLVRLILNQIGRRLTEELEAKKHRRRLLLMLDEFPALGRLDFFESALAFMAGYGLKSFLIAQSLNQIEKAYGQNNSILDNCHVRVSFATNDERTAKRVSDALGTATEMRAMKNYAGHRLSPWLGHLMVSRQETARPLLTPGEVMQLPPADELILVSGCHPIRAKKVRYFEDPEMKGRILPPPALTSPSPPLGGGSAAPPSHGDWDDAVITPSTAIVEDPTNAGIRREPELPEHEEIVAGPRKPVQEFEPLEDEPDDEVQRQRGHAAQLQRRHPPDAARSHRRSWHVSGYADEAHLPPAAGARRKARRLRQS